MGKTRSRKGKLPLSNPVIELLRLPSPFLKTYGVAKWGYLHVITFGFIPFPLYPPFSLLGWGLNPHRHEFSYLPSSSRLSILPCEGAQ